MLSDTSSSNLNDLASLHTWWVDHGLRTAAVPAVGNLPGQLRPGPGLLISMGSEKRKRGDTTPFCPPEKISGSTEAQLFQVSNLGFNQVGNEACVFDNFIVGEPNHGIAAMFKHSLPVSVMFDLDPFRVVATVDLDYEAIFRAQEVNDVVGGDAALASELDAEFLFAKMKPEDF